MTRWLAGSGRDVVALVLVGDELLVGDVVDTNSAWLGRRLTEAGLRVVTATHVADDLDAQVSMMRRALHDAPNVIVTGGLGPTSDDVSRAALARLAGVPLRRDPRVVEVLRDWYARYRTEFPATALQMADLPEGASSLGNLQGSAPGIRLEVAEGVVYAVPGVPHEMRAMIEEYVLPDLLTRAGALPVTRTESWRVVGLRESVLAARLEPLEAELAEAGGDIAYVAGPGQVRVRITVVRPAGSDSADVDATLGGWAAQVADLLGDAVAGPGEVPLDVLVHRLLAERGATVATAESFTGGLLGAALTTMPGSSATYRGGVVAYATPLKHDLLDVSTTQLTERGAVDPGTAAEMAEGARTRLGADYGVATTGVAGPTLQEGHPPGTVHIAVVGPAGATGSEGAGGSAPAIGPDRVFIRSLRLPGDRDSVREAGVVHALDLLRRKIIGLPVNPAAESPERPAG